MNDSDIDMEYLEQWTRHEPDTGFEMLDLRPALIRIVDGAGQHGVAAYIV